MALSGVGTKFRRWNDGTSSWETIAEVTNISGPNMSRGTYDSTALDTEGGYRTFISGFRDPGTLSLSMNFNRDGYELMKGDFEDEVNKNYEILLPDADTTSLEFEGFVTECPLEVPTDGIITADISIQVSGKVNLESGSGPSPNA